MAECDLEHEGDFGNDQAGYRRGARDIHDAGAMLYTREVAMKKKKKKRKKKRKGKARVGGHAVQVQENVHRGKKEKSGEIRYSGSR